MPVRSAYRPSEGITINHKPWRSRRAASAAGEKYAKLSAEVCEPQSQGSSGIHPMKTMTFVATLGQT